MQKTVGTLLATLLIAAATPAWATNRQADHDLEQAMQTYYRNPDPAQALAVVQGFITHPAYIQKPGKTFMLNYWGAAALRQHPDQTMRWCQSVRQHDAQTQRRASGLFAMARTPDAAKCLQSLDLTEQQRRQLLAQPPINPLQQAITSPLDLDLLWTHFFATGNAEAVVKIADYAVRNRAELSHDPAHAARGEARQRLLLTLAAAHWSLGSNARQDARVRQILSQHAQTLGQADRTWLEQEILRPAATGR